MATRDQLPADSPLQNHPHPRVDTSTHHPSASFFAQHRESRTVTTQRWEYKVVHINVTDNSSEPDASGGTDPKQASARLQGVLSPEFISREFPERYGAPSPPKHPSEQLQIFLNRLGQEGWELVEAPQVGPLLMFIFRKPLPPPPRPARSASAAVVTSAGCDAASICSQDALGPDGLAGGSP